MFNKKRSLECDKKYILNNGEKNDKRMFKNIFDLKNKFSLNNFKFILECEFDNFDSDMHFDNVFRNEKPSILKKFKKFYLEEILLRTTKESVIAFKDLNFIFIFQRGDYYTINLIYNIVLVTFLSIFIGLYFDKDFKQLIEEKDNIKKNK